MKKFQVITDSTSDLIALDRETYNIDYVKMAFTIEDNNYEADLDWNNISAKDFYSSMRNGKRAITTLVSGKEFEEKFVKYFKEGLDILYISCSSKLSGSIKNAEIIANELKEQYPDRRVICLDSLRSNYSEGLMTIDAAKMANDGKSIEETYDAITTNRLQYQTFATVSSLEWLKKAGRVKAATAFFGNLIGVKPIIISDAHGNNYAFRKEKGRKNALDTIVNCVIENTNENSKMICVEHADSEKDAEYVANAIKSRLPDVEIKISYMGPIIGASTGPDTIIISFIGKEVTIFEGNN